MPTADAAARLVATAQCLHGGELGGGSASMPSLDLLVLILSSQQQQLSPSRRRESVRRSWAFPMAILGAPNATAEEHCSMRHLFVVGGGTGAAHLGSPSGESDVLVLPVADGYRQIAHKVLASLQWAVSQVRFRYLLKTDDDSYVCASRLLELLHPMPRAQLYLGVVNRDHKVIMAKGRTLYERWRDPTYIRLFNRSVYAPYMQGAGYVLSADAAQHVVARAQDLPAIPAIEDALVGTLLEGTASPVHRPAAFRHKNRDDYAVSVCAQDTEFVLLHKLNESELGRCRQATARRRSDACPGGPCVCANLGRKMKRPRRVVARFADGAKAVL